MLRDPTTGGVAASCALLGDVNVAEPGALIGFAGPRVIESTIRQKLPEGFQRSEFLLAHGMIDMIVARPEMKASLSTLIMHMTVSQQGPLTNGHSDAPRAAAGPMTAAGGSPLERLYRLAPRGALLGLERMRAACATMGHPERAFASLHIAGTNGKGSVAAMLASMARAHGVRVGLYTSPHLCEFRERIQIDGEPAAEDELAANLDEVLSACPN